MIPIGTVSNRGEGVGNRIDNRVVWKISSVYSKWLGKASDISLTFEHIQS